LTSGEVRVVIEDSGHLIGADGEGKALVITIGSTVWIRVPRWLSSKAIAVRWKQRLNLPVGVPALVSGYVLVPWATQRLSVLSARDGRELARWDFQHAVARLRASGPRSRVHRPARLDCRSISTRSSNAAEAVHSVHTGEAAFAGAAAAVARRLCAGARAGQRGEPAQARLAYRRRQRPAALENDLVALRFSPFLV